MLSFASKYKLLHRACTPQRFYQDTQTQNSLVEFPAFAESMAKLYKTVKNRNKSRNSVELCSLTVFVHLNFKALL